MLFAPQSALQSGAAAASFAQLLFAAVHTAVVMQNIESDFCKMGCDCLVSLAVSVRPASTLLLRAVHACLYTCHVACCVPVQLQCCLCWVWFMYSSGSLASLSVADGSDLSG